MLLEEAGIDYRISPVDISAGDQFKPDFLAFSPRRHRGPGGRTVARPQSPVQL